MPAAAVELEPLSEAHAAELFDFLQAKEIYTYIPEGPPDSVSALESRYRFIINGANSKSSEKWFNWVLREQDSGQPVGVLQATVTPGERTAS